MTFVYQLEGSLELSQSYLLGSDSFLHTLYLLDQFKVSNDKNNRLVHNYILTTMFVVVFYRTMLDLIMLSHRLLSYITQFY